MGLRLQSGPPARPRTWLRHLLFLVPLQLRLSPLVADACAQAAGLWPAKTNVLSGPPATQVGAALARERAPTGLLEDGLIETGAGVPHEHTFGQPHAMGLAERL